MTVSITNVARGVRLARDSGVPLSDILENRNFTTLDMKDRASVVKEYATTHETEARPLDTKQRIKTLAYKAAWGALSGAAAGIPVAMVVRSGFLPLSKSPKALLSGLKMAAGDNSVRFGVGLMAGMGGAQGIYNAVNKFRAQESDRIRVHNTLEKIRTGNPDESDAHAYGAMFGAIRHYDDPKPTTTMNPIIQTIGATIKPWEKAINSVNYGRLVHESDAIDMDGTRFNAETDFQNVSQTAKNIQAMEAIHKQEIPNAKDIVRSAIQLTTDEEMANADKIREIVQKAKILKGMLEETGKSSVLNETQQGYAEELERMSTSAEQIPEILKYLKDLKDSK